MAIVAYMFNVIFFFLALKSPGQSPGSGLQARHPGLGLGPGEYEARARQSRAQARAFRPSRAPDITQIFAWVCMCEYCSTAPRKNR
ncbi:hypothetical protein C8R45DRAFT_1008370 [Mycena sanguinolenta]|nr:hypothetical protein C8R45DRAFT_1008370 [Mycena sanguinolenta]